MNDWKPDIETIELDGSGNGHIRRFDVASGVHYNETFSALDCWHLLTSGKISEQLFRQIYPMVRYVKSLFFKQFLEND